MALAHLRSALTRALDDPRLIHPSLAAEIRLRWAEDKCAEELAEKIEKDQELEFREAILREEIRETGTCPDCGTSITTCEC
jgi:hypothetical protein